MSSKMLRSAAAALGGLAVPVAVGVVGAGPASADNNDWCISGQFGYAQACLNLPGWHAPDWDFGQGWHHSDGEHHGDHGDG